METIGRQTLRSFGRSGDIEEMECTAVRKGEAVIVSSFKELASKIATLQFCNRDFVFLFRGQDCDYRNKAGNTTIRPALLRPNDPKKAPNAKTIKKRFEDLETHERKLLVAYKRSFPDNEAVRRLRRERILRWSILQHYEVCPTPLLDVTHSLRIAASFASDWATDEAFVFVLGLPNLSGAITASIEAGLQIVRLSSVCPPTALRPHIQEGYLLAEYPDIATADQKELYRNYEMDFGRRLVAKFKFNPRIFWPADSNFPPVLHDALYPSNDPLEAVAHGLRSKPKK